MKSHAGCDVFKTNGVLFRRTVNIHRSSAGTVLPRAAPGRVAASHNNHHLTAQKTEEETQTSVKKRLSGSEISLIRLQTS